MTAANTAPLIEAQEGTNFVPTNPARAADILALTRAAMDALARAVRSSPEVREHRVMARWPVDLEDLLLELDSLRTEVPIPVLAARLGVSAAQLRSTALRLQRLSLVKVAPGGVSLTATGRQKLARLEMARAEVFRRIASGYCQLNENEASQVIWFLRALLDRSEAVADEQVGTRAE